MAKRNKLTIYLIKEKFTDNNGIIKEFEKKKKIKENTMLYYGSSRSKAPIWVEDFLDNQVDEGILFTANAKAVALVKVNVEADKSRVFAIVMGYGKGMIEEETIEERFGLKTCLNAIEDTEIRKVNKANIGGNQRVSSNQLPVKSSMDEFDVDVDSELISQVTGETRKLGKGIISGNDALFCSAEYNINNIEEFLKKIFDCYIGDEYKEKFGWIDKIKSVKNKELISQLDEYLVEAVNDRSDEFWMAPPEIIEWESINGYCYGGSIHEALSIDIVLDSFRDEIVSLDQIKRKQIKKELVDGAEVNGWKMYKCIYGECEIEGSNYCINAGKWYNIDKNFVKDIKENYKDSEISKIEFPNREATHKSENDYVSFVATEEKFTLMDKSLISYGGGHSKIEVCDLLYESDTLIHVKTYEGSSTLSHLFNQGVVSIELLTQDSEFLKKANDKISEIKGEPFQLGELRELKVVYLITSNKKNDLPQLPFFSKVAYKNTKDKFKMYGIDVSIKGVYADSGKAN